MQSASPSFAAAILHLVALALAGGVFLAAAVAFPLRKGRPRGRAAASLAVGASLLAILLLPDDRRAMASEVALPLGLGALLFAVALRGLLPGGGAARKGGALLFGASGGALVLVTASVAYLTSSHSAFSGETLAALVEVVPTRFEAPFTHRTERAEVTYRAGTEAVEVAVATVAGDRGDFRGRFLLPGDSWGLGGRILEIDRYYLFLGKKTFFRVTDIQARFRGRPTEPHYGEPIGPAPPEADAAKLAASLPFGAGTLASLFGAESRPFDEYDAVVYPAARGRHFAVFAKSAGGFVPRSLDAAAFRAEVARLFDGKDPFAQPDL